MLTASWRKLVLLLHVATSVGFIGSVAAFLALAIVGVTASDGFLTRAVYVAAGIVTWDVIVPLAWASLLIGIVQSIGTPWGLFRYYWVIIKLVLTIVATLVLMLQAQTIAAVAALALSGDVANAGSARFGMILHGTGGIVVLLVITVLSIYKPKGLTRAGLAASEAGR